jgi:hypothetical protein
MKDDTPSKSPRRKRPEIFNPPEVKPKVTWEKQKNRVYHYRSISGRKYRIPSKEIVEDSLYWRIRGYDFDEVTREAREIENKDGILEVKLVTTKIVTKQLVPDVQAIIFGATNLIPEKYKQKQTVETTGKDGGPLQVEVLGAAKELLSSRISSLSAKMEAGSDPGGVDP